jgi:uncharacterized protein YoxC
MEWFFDWFPTLPLWLQLACAAWAMAFVVLLISTANALKTAVVQSVTDHIAASEIRTTAQIDQLLHKLNVITTRLKYRRYK